MTEQLSDIEAIVRDIGILFLQRHGTPVPFYFGQVEWKKHTNRNKTAVFWLPRPSAVVPGTQPKKTPSRMPELPKHYLAERFEVVCQCTSFAGAYVLHKCLIDTLSWVPGEIEFGNFERTSEAETVASPLLNGATVVQEVTIITEVPNVPTAAGVGSELWTVLNTDHECYIVNSDGTEEQNCVIST